MGKIKQALSMFIGGGSKNKEIKYDSLYDYSTAETRQETVSFLVLTADSAKQDTVKTWNMCDNYYNNIHDAQDELVAYCRSKNIPWIPAIIPDPYIHVESQINPDLPDFEFVGRDDDLDGQKAKMRQYVAQYVFDSNEMIMKHNRNERRLGKYGNCIWKVGYDYNIELPRNVHGNIFVHDLDPKNFINDSISVDIDDGEYHAYVYNIHRMKAARVFEKELKKLGKTIGEIGNGLVYNVKTLIPNTYDTNFDIVQVTEFWFRQPIAGSEKIEKEITDSITGETKTVEVVIEWEAGDIACSIQINDIELKYIPKYWEKTSKQNKMFPFAIGYKIPVENRFWGKSELETIKELVDAADRELAITILNDTFMSNDIIIMDDNAMAEGSEPENHPGAIWKVRDGKNVKRLAGLSNLNGGLKDTVAFIRDLIKQTIGNFDVNMGDAPPPNIRSLGALVQMREQGHTRQNKKKAGSVAMWERVLKLIDYTAIEFFDDDRMIFLGADSKQPEQIQQPWKQQAQEGGGTPNATPTDPNTKNQPINFKFNSNDIMSMDTKTNEYYYPVVDYRINIGDGITNSPAMTIDATEQLAKMTITIQNKEIVKSLVDLMKLPNKTIIKNSIDEFFNAQSKTPALFKDMPKISIDFGDLPQDAQLQLLQQIGVQSQGGLSNDQKLEKEKIETSAGVQQQTQQEELTPEEIQHLQENPQLLQQFMKQHPQHVSSIMGGK